MPQQRTVRLSAAAAALLCLQLAAHAGGPGHGHGPDDRSVLPNLPPAGVASLSRTEYRATSPGPGTSAATQDLLTAGWGKTGLATGVAGYADAANPTALELRRNAILSNYRGLIDVTANGGYGRLYGPNIDLDGHDTLGEGLVPGVEYLGVVDVPGGNRRVTTAVQLPDSFDPAKPCIVVAPSSGSRGVYGGIGTVAEWGLKRGCAVALSDAGKGMGLHDLSDDSVHQIDGTRDTSRNAGALSHFSARMGEAQRTAFNALYPNRVALKHAHAETHSERDWGTDTLAAARYALWVLNQEHGPRLGHSHLKGQHFRPDNTLVIAASVSNGGTAVLRAAEADTEGLIDAVVAGEPGATPRSTQGYGVQQGGVPVAFGKPLLDYFSFANLYQPCAALAAEASMGGELSFHNYMTLTGMNPRAANRCASLAQAGLVNGADTAAQAADALARLRAYGWGPYNDTMHNAHYGLGNAVIVTSMYANGYGRFSVLDNLCGVSFAGVDATGAPAPIPAAAKAVSYATGNGTANGVPATVIVNEAVGGARRWDLAVSPGTALADLGFEAALCQRALVTGTDPRTGVPLTARSTPTRQQSEAVRQGIREVLASGHLRHKPALVIAGRSDALLPVNNAGRAYAAFNHAVEGAASRLRYIEVSNGQHFDGFLGLAGFDTRYIPLHVYFVDGLNAMYAHLSGGAPLPASQLVRTTPRGGTPGAAPALTRAAHLLPIATVPAAADAITFDGKVLNVPN
ncbi:3-hydroxybutyrate oligomer hydrolase family protein [Azohydromonas caseinilytica]|uniref:Hydrogenase n=1 Tax=Azohydromonas caseinilytica TaxID=2728836 RepID=A0A848FAM6_9BURK|nr:3-hydroxybutyrate oligomer hydrolase family protein [Azohydromonas caseinilytica]NML16338.1 hydrogenase [Azohydromonas caseinilytica]